MSSYNQLDLETMGYRLIMPKNLPRHGHRSQPSSAICFCINNQDPTFMIINCILMVTWGSKVGTCYLVEAHETQVRWRCSLLFNIRQFDLQRHLILRHLRNHLRVHIPRTLNSQTRNGHHGSLNASKLETTPQCAKAWKWNQHTINLIAARKNTLIQ